jgi:hypothetical protein
MSIDSARENADVRFFGAHDRAWVPVSHCLIFSDKDPNKSGKATPTNNKSKSQKGIADAIKEKDEYIQNMKERFGFRLVNVLCLAKRRHMCFLHVAHAYFFV